MWTRTLLDTFPNHNDKSACSAFSNKPRTLPLSRRPRAFPEDIHVCHLFRLSTPYPHPQQRLLPRLLPIINIISLLIHITHRPLTLIITQQLRQLPTSASLKATLLMRVLLGTNGLQTAATGSSQVQLRMDRASAAIMGILPRRPLPLRLPCILSGIIITIMLLKRASMDTSKTPDGGTSRLSIWRRDNKLCKPRFVASHRKRTWVCHEVSLGLCLSVSLTFCFFTLFVSHCSPLTHTHPSPLFPVSIRILLS